MSKTSIAWTDRTENPLTGCTEEGPECLNCYARIASASPRLQQFEKYHGVVDEKGRWTGQINFTPKVLDDLLKTKKEHMQFMPSMSDPFHSGVKDEWLNEIFAAVILTPHITHQVLTKRHERMYEYFDNLDLRQLVNPARDLLSRNNKTKAIGDWKLPIKNLWLGVTCGTQRSADKRIPYLQKVAEMRYTTFVSVEPMLEEVDLTGLLDGIAQVIIGGESGFNARPFHLEWARSLIEQCRVAGVKVFMKQVGSNAFYEGKPYKTKSRAGSDLAEWPEWAQIQEFPDGVK
jgi:protein gp37